MPEKDKKEDQPQTASSQSEPTSSYENERLTSEEIAEVARKTLARKVRINTKAPKASDSSPELPPGQVINDAIQNALKN